ncbi:MAG: hypothetical protein AAB767_01965 [Patescibacteria group bacterium]
MKIINEKISSFLQKVESLKKEGGVDLSAAEDLSLAVMNLISLEEHFFFTGAKTKDASYYDLSGEIRAMRTRLMEGLVEKHEGETWCSTKHLLSATMRLIETGNRYIASGDKKKAEGLFADAYRLYTIFWALKTKLVSASTLAAEGKKAKEEGWSLEQLVNKLADCCDEK